MFVDARSLVLASVCLLVSAGSLAAGQPPQRPPAAAPALPAGQETAVSAGQIQRWFEAFTVLQAQEALDLSEAQYGRFVTRLKGLQDIRRRHQMNRNQIMGDLRKLTNPQIGSIDEAALTDRLKSLRDEDDRATADVRKAYDGVDETLNLRQQARFRIFEERMEQQRLELLMRTRQNARAAQRGRGKS
jgi:DNA-binding phage protein